MPDKRVTELTAIDAVTDTDLVMVIDDPAGTAVNKKATVTQLLADVARTDVSNTFTGDQTVDGDLFVTGEVNPVVFARQKAKIDLFTGVSPGDPVGSRTVMSQSLISGLALRHDEALSIGRISVGNYDAQLYQPLLFECEEFQVHTGVSPGDRVERLRVHPSGGVTVGADHTVDPGTGSVAVATLDLKEGIPSNPALDTGRLYALDVNGFTQVEMRDANAKVVRFASDNILIAKVSGVAITRGQSIYLSGASGANPLAGLARSDAIATMPCVGLALDSGVVNAFIRVLVAGTMQLLDTSAFAEGARVYVSPTTAGAMTTTVPVAPNYAQRIGIVTRTHATQGEVLVLTTSVDGPPRLHHDTHEPGGSDALTTLDASTLLTGIVPDARLSANVQMKPLIVGDLPTNVALKDAANTFTQLQTITNDLILDNAGVAKLRFGPAGVAANPLLKRSGSTIEVRNGTDTAFVILRATLTAGDITSGTLPNARIQLTASPRLLGRGSAAAGAMEEIVLGTGLTMSGTTLNAEGGSTLPPTVAYTDAANVFTQDQWITKPGPTLRFTDPGAAVDAQLWVLGIDNQPDFCLQTRSNAGVVQGTPLLVTRAGNMTVGGMLTVNAANPRIDLFNTSGSVDSRLWRIEQNGGILSITPCSDAGVVQASTVNFYRGGSTEWYSPVSYYSTAKFYYDTTIGGILQVGGATLSASLPAFRATGSRMDVVTGTQSAYASLYCLNIGSAGGGNSLADLTVTGAASLQSTLLVGGAVDITGGSGTDYSAAPIEIRMASNPRIGFHWPAVVASQIGMDSAGTIRTFDNPGSGFAPFSAGVITSSGNMMCGGNLHITAGYLYPGNVAAGGGYQGSWYLASHSSYGLYTNTGLYCAGDVWYQGISVAGALAGKHPLMTPTYGAISMAYATLSANHNNPTAAAAPAGGTGTAAGGWSTAANRDIAIGSINALRTDVNNTKQVLGHVIMALKAMGILL